MSALLPEPLLRARQPGRTLSLEHHLLLLPRLPAWQPLCGETQSHWGWQCCVESAVTICHNAESAARLKLLHGDRDEQHAPCRSEVVSYTAFVSLSERICFCSCVLKHLIVFHGNHQAVDERERVVCVHSSQQLPSACCSIFTGGGRRGSITVIGEMSFRTAVIYSQALFFIKSYRQLQHPFK